MAEDSSGGTVSDEPTGSSCRRTPPPPPPSEGEDGAGEEQEAVERRRVVVAAAAGVEKRRRTRKGGGVAGLGSQRRVALAFGRNYSHAMAGAAPRRLPERTDDEQEEGDGGGDGDEEGEGGDDEPEDASVAEPQAVDAYQWDVPPWLLGGDDDQHRSSTAKDTDGDDAVLQQVACTHQSTVFLTRAGRAYQAGTLHGRATSNAVPVRWSLPARCVQVAAGRHFCLALLSATGTTVVVSWGAGHFGQLGTGPDVHHYGGGGEDDDYSRQQQQQQQMAFSGAPVLVERLLPHVTGSPVTAVAAGDWHAMALTASGRVWSWGCNRHQQCGRKCPSSSSSAPQQQAPTLTVPLPVPLPAHVTKITAGRSHSAVLARTTLPRGAAAAEPPGGGRAPAQQVGQVICWGSSNNGQCGNCVTRRSVSGVAPSVVESLRDLDVVDVAAGGNHTVALTSGGRVLTWGSGSEGELGLGPAINSQCKPRLVADLDFVAIAAGQEWKQQQRKPQQQQAEGVADFSHIPRITAVYAGPSYSAAVSSSGHLYVWGSNDAGQLGVPTPEHMPYQDNTVGTVSKSPPKPTSTVRDMHVCTFDSRHNVLLPIRVAAAEHVRVEQVACGPNHMWIVGQTRVRHEEPGRTLYEVQEEQRRKRLVRARNSLRAKARRRRSSSATDEEKMSAAAASECLEGDVKKPAVDSTTASSTSASSSFRASTTMQPSSAQEDAADPYHRHRTPTLATSHLSLTPAALEAPATPSTSTTEAGFVTLEETSLASPTMAVPLADSSSDTLQQQMSSVETPKKNPKRMGLVRRLSRRFLRRSSSGNQGRRSASGTPSGSAEMHAVAAAATATPADRSTSSTGRGR